jgi:hypothetical protein
VYFRACIANGACGVKTEVMQTLSRGGKCSEHIMNQTVQLGQATLGFNLKRKP